MAKSEAIQLCKDMGIVLEGYDDIDFAMVKKKKKPWDQKRNTVTIKKRLLP